MSMYTSPMACLDTFTAAYAEAMIWADLRDADGEPLDDYDMGDIHPDSLRRIIDDCAAFQADYWTYWDCNHIPCDAEAGHDYWLTRQGHGAGFWDRKELYGRRNAESLDDAARIAGPLTVELGDDGRVHIL